MADFFDFALHPIHVAIAAFIVVIVLYLASKSYLKMQRGARSDQPTSGSALARVQAGAAELANQVISVTETEDGVAIETALACMGAYAGYICQASIRKEMVEGRGMAENSAFAVFTAANGQTFFFGDLLNKVLAEAELSIWGFASNAVEHLDVSVTVDVEEIFKYVTSTIGTPQFGIPRIPTGHDIGPTPIIRYAQAWQSWLPLLNQYCDSPKQWSLLMGYAIHAIIMHSKGLIDPNVALKIVMECAIPMSKVDLTSTQPV